MILEYTRNCSSCNPCSIYVKMETSNRKGSSFQHSSCISAGLTADLKTDKRRNTGVSKQSRALIWTIFIHGVFLGPKSFVANGPLLRHEGPKRPHKHKDLTFELQGLRPGGYQKPWLLVGSLCLCGFFGVSVTNFLLRSARLAPDSNSDSSANSRCS